MEERSPIGSDIVGDRRAKRKIETDFQLQDAHPLSRPASNVLATGHHSDMHAAALSDIMSSLSIPSQTCRKSESIR